MVPNGKDTVLHSVSLAFECSEQHTLISLIIVLLVITIVSRIIWPKSGYLVNLNEKMVLDLFFILLFDLNLARLWPLMVLSYVSKPRLNVLVIELIVLEHYDHLGVCDRRR